jgi:hypothetical protein
MRIQDHVLQILKTKRFFFALFFSLSFSWGFKDVITLVLLGGKTFAGRSLFAQLWILALISLVAFLFFLCAFYALGWLLAKSGDWFSQKLKLVGNQVNQIVLRKTSVWIFPILVGLVFLNVQIRLISFPYQLEYREGAVFLTTEGLLHGINPYTLENNPLYINVYGIAYNLFVLPLAFVFGNSLALHRIVSAAFIFGQVGLVILVLRQRKISWLLAVIAGLFIWLGQLASTSPLARPDTLGEFLFLGSLFAPYFFGFNLASVIAGLVFGIAGFYTKPYFILGLPILLSYLFLFVSKKKAILAGFGALIGLLATALIVNLFFEAYFLNTIYSHIADAGDSFPYLIGQIITFTQNYWSILWVSALALVGLVVKTDFHADFQALKIDLLDFGRPFFASKLNYFIYCLIIPAFLIYFSLGRHTGATQIYFYQLLTPFVMIQFISWIDRMDWQKGLVVLLVMINLVTHSIQNLTADLDFSVKPGWSQLEQALLNRSSVLNSPVSVSILAANHQAIVDSGQTWYYRKIPMTPTLFYPDMAHWKQVDVKFTNSIQDRISQKLYDLIMLDQMNQYEISRDDVQIYYEQAEEIILEMPHTSEIWRIELWRPR